MPFWILKKIRRFLNQIRKATLWEINKFWSEFVEDIDYTEQDAIVNGHVSPNEIEAFDTDRWAQIMEAQSRKDRPVDASEWALSQLAQGKTRKEVKYWQEKYRLVILIREFLLMANNRFKLLNL